jgi:ribosome-associated protein
LESKEKVRLIVSAALDKKALDPVVFRTAKLTDLADYVVILSGTSDRQVRAIGDHIDDELRKAGERPIGVEGEKEGRWMLIDGADVIVHIFHQPVRTYYDLERLWMDAPRFIPDVPGLDEAKAAASAPENNLGR